MPQAMKETTSNGIRFQLQHINLRFNGIRFPGEPVGLLNDLALLDP